MGKFKAIHLLVLMAAVLLSLLFINASKSEVYWKSTFRDEFKGNQLNRNLWATRYFWNDQDGRTLRRQHGERQCYRDENVSVSNGKLRIKAIAKNNRCGAYNQDYTSGMISAHKTMAQKYGYFEIRADIPSGQGTWPAFWSMPVKPKDGGDPERAEIDIFEHLGRQPNNLHLNLHWDGDRNQAKKVIYKKGRSFVDGYHTYSVLWESRKVIWYYNGMKVHEIKAGQIPGSYIPREPMYLIANLAIGGDWAWNPTPAQQKNFKKHFNVDYIRAFQKRNSSARRPNYIKNFSFENSKRYWKTFGNNTLSRDEYHGDDALKLSGSAGAEQVVSGLRPYSVYRLSAYIKDYDGSGSGKASTQIGVKNYGGGQQLADWRVAKNRYKKLELVFSTGNTDKATIFVYQSNGTAVVDRFELKAL